MELGLYTFAELTPDPVTGRTIAPAQRLANLIEEASSPTRSGWTSSASASITGPTSPSPPPPSPSPRRPRARSTSASRARSASSARTTRCASSSSSPRSTCSRAAGPRSWRAAARSSSRSRSSATTSHDYDELFVEKLELLLRCGRASASPGPVATVPRSTASASTPGPRRSRCRSGSRSAATPRRRHGPARSGLPMALAIIGGMPERFAPFAEIHRRAALEAGQELPGAQHQLARLHRRHLAGGGRDLLAAVRGDDDQDRPRARLAADDAGTSSKPRARCAARTSSAARRR